MRLYINVDHVATVRQARGTTEPDPVEAAALCERAGADGITVHLREDRRHIQDEDVRRLATSVRTVLNLELATADEILALAVSLRPHQATLVPERRMEITTEGGLPLGTDPDGDRRLRDAVARLKDAGIRVSLFVDPDADIIERSADLGAHAVELHTGRYCLAFPDARRELDRLATAARHAASLGLAVHAGHGLNLANVPPVARLPEVEELNIGHSIIGRAVMVGMERAVAEMRVVVDAARVDQASAGP
ncbi:MAG: pyridoxine 5'-phosphate synthase [Gemmatimonadota bacterium]|nr:pyridoxine 5'-phosphate synthase [Gemmatimonadota bacterium]MDH5197886.1 pyridoxine 5'-phosphate synthase [Gemmatimonadota bacterium]